jgi:hypothetical protein
LKYIGKTNQPLFDIQFVNKNEQTGEDGDFYKVTLSSRVSGEKVVDFLNDYLGTINVLDFTQLYKNMLDLISGAFSMKLNKSTDSLRKQTAFEKFLQRCLGLCFDNRQEIDVSGAGDTFTSAFTVKYLETKDIRQSIIFANEMSAIVVSKRGVATP